MSTFCRIVHITLRSVHILQYLAQLYYIFNALLKQRSTHLSYSCITHTVKETTVTELHSKWLTVSRKIYFANTEMVTVCFATLYTICIDIKKLELQIDTVS